MGRSLPKFSPSNELSAEFLEKFAGPMAGAKAQSDLEPIGYESSRRSALARKNVRHLLPLFVAFSSEWHSVGVVNPTAGGAYLGIW